MYYYNPRNEQNRHIDKVDTAMTTLRGRARGKRTMWSRRAQEYEAKIHSGDPVSIAEVVRDLHRATGQHQQARPVSFSNGVSPAGEGPQVRCVNRFIRRERPERFQHSPCLGTRGKPKGTLFSL